MKKQIMRINLSKITIFLVASGIFCGCTDESYQTTLFDGEVTYCVSKRNTHIFAYAKQGMTGKFVLDTAQRPSKTHLNDILKPYGWVYKPHLKGDPAWVPSGVPRWRRQCKLKLPSNASAYHIVRSGAIIYDEDGEIIGFPAGYKGWASLAWFVDDRLVHVEVGQ